MIATWKGGRGMGEKGEGNEEVKPLSYKFSLGDVNTA